MSVFNDVPFGRGQTLGVTATTDGVQWEGVEKWFDDIDYSAPPKRRSNRKVLCRVVRNVSGVAILGKRLVVFKAGTGNKQIDGYARTVAQFCVATDEYLPTGGVANNDLFWVVLQGPAMLTTAVEAEPANYAEGDFGIAQTAAASTHSTTAGRVAAATYTSTHATGVGLNAIGQNNLGRALSARTTADTNSNVLFDIRRY